MNSGRFGVFVLIGLAIVVAGLSLFTVNERELAIKLRVGEVVESNYEPGLQWKIPIIETVRKFPKRILTIRDRPDRIFTAENEALEVDYFVKYRIVDPVRFYTSTGGYMDVAARRLGEIVQNAVLTEFGKGVKQNRKMAADWYRKAGMGVSENQQQGGHKNARKSFCRLVATADFIPEDDPQFAQWCK